MASVRYNDKLGKWRKKYGKDAEPIVFHKKFGTIGGNIGTTKSSRPYPKRRPKIADQRKQVKDQDLQNILVAPKRPSNIL